jgi:single-strand DNA-binding protein
MNKIILIGNLCRNAEIKKLDTGTTVATFTIAVNWNKEHTDYFNLTAFGKIAELVEQFTEKGTKVAVCGSIHIRTYTKKDGTKGTETNVEVDTIDFLTKKEQTQAPVDNFTVPEQEVADDDLPF